MLIFGILLTLVGGTVLLIGCRRADLSTVAAAFHTPSFCAGLLITLIGLALLFAAL